jgi:hypothetical protein
VGPGHGRHQPRANETGYSGLESRKEPPRRDAKQIATQPLNQNSTGDEMRYTAKCNRRLLRAPCLPAFLAVVLLVGLASWGVRSQQPPILPDPKLTPGATLPVTKDDICVPGYTKKVRDVPQSVKDQVYAEYGITSHQPREFEIDHLISLELGGSNSIKNLWPESYLTKPWNAHVKDQLKNWLHELAIHQPPPGAPPRLRCDLGGAPPACDRGRACRGYLIR